MVNQIYLNNQIGTTCFLTLIIFFTSNVFQVLKKGKYMIKSFK